MGILLFFGEAVASPSGGFNDVSANYTGLRAVIDIAAHLTLPVTTLALIYFAIYLRIMRASMLEVMTLDFIRTARAKERARRASSSATPCATRPCRW